MKPISHATEITRQLQPDGDFDAVIINIPNTGAANTDYPLTHTLGRTPIACQMILKDKTGDAYKGTRWNSQVIDIRFTSANINCNLVLW